MPEEKSPAQDIVRTQDTVRVTAVIEFPEVLLSMPPVERWLGETIGEWAAKLVREIRACGTAREEVVEKIVGGARP